MSTWIGGALLVLLLTPGAPGQDAHPNDHKIVFFKKADRETNDEIEKAVTKFFLDNQPSERAAGRAICNRSPLWSVPILVDLVAQRRKSQPIQRWNAILTLAAIVDPRAAHVLRVAAEKDSTPQVRAFACLALGLHGGPESVEVLIRALKHERSQDVVTAATFALARIGGPDAETAIQDLVRRDRTHRNREAGLVGLGLFPSSRTMETARKALGDSRSGVVRRGVLTLVNAAFGPRETRREELQEIFEKTSEDAEARAIALIALARFVDDRGASRVLAKALRDPDEVVVEAAARALQNRGDPRTREEVIAKLKQTVDGDAQLAARLLIALAAIEARNPTEEGLGYLVGRLGSRGPAMRIYAAIALTRVGENFHEQPELRGRAVRVLRSALGGGALGDEERASFRRALALLDPENAPEEVPEEWASAWTDDPVLPTIGETLYDVMLEKTNWFVAEELQIHTIPERPETRRDLASGTDRKIKSENRELRDLREWLRGHPYFTEAELPDRGYGE